ncbi:hypothetical protein ACMXYV_06770 [Neptuniibacter sp. SY11_33]|uniref:hypothetical protein n=1 Tax=Neptuniibacter sp. SY11_33 TaxID=3398215 RepID=UPI0039F5E46C
MEFSFGINSFDEYWASTNRKVESFLADDLNEELAIECASKIWHLCDWYYEENKAALKYKQLSDLQGEVGNACSSLRVMRDICNGSKHGSLEKTRTPVIRKTQKHKGAFSSGFSQGFDVSVLEIQLTDGTEVCFIEAVQQAIEYWNCKLQP